MHCAKCKCKIYLAGLDEKAWRHQLCWLCIVRGWERTWWGWVEGVAGVGGEAGSWVPYPEAKILPSLGSSTSPHPSTHTRELKIPFTLTGARSWLEKARDKKQFSTEQNHHNGLTLICTPPHLSTPTSANWTLSPCNCHPRWDSPSTLNEVVHSNLVQTAFEVSGSSAASTLSFLLSPLANFKWPAGQYGQFKTEREKFKPASLLRASSPPSRPSNRGMQCWHVDNQPWGPATSKAWRAPKNTNVRPNGTLH